jgi:hypothetical protein
VKLIWPQQSQKMMRRILQHSDVIYRKSWTAVHPNFNNVYNFYSGFILLLILIWFITPISV